MTGYAIPFLLDAEVSAHYSPYAMFFSFIFWVKGKKDWKLPTISLLVLIRSTLFFLPNNTLFYFFLFSRIQVRYRL
jgi:hypothetical protein